MTSNVTKMLLSCLPQATAWAESSATDIAVRGSPLSERGIAIANEVGVADPIRVRILVVDAIPMPTNPQLRAVAMDAGLLEPTTVAMTLGHGIYVVKRHASWRLLAHELRHVHQYEVAGSISAFLPVYLEQIARFGYFSAPLEVDARAHEIAAAAVRGK